MTTTSAQYSSGDTSGHGTEQGAALPVSEQSNGNAGLVRLWCKTCRRYGDHMSNKHPAPTVIPDCQGCARFDTLDHAEYLMNGMVEEFGGTWRVMKHGEHFHVTEVAHA